MIKCKFILTAGKFLHPIYKKKRQTLWTKWLQLIPAAADKLGKCDFLLRVWKRSFSHSEPGKRRSESVESAQFNTSAMLSRINSCTQQEVGHFTPGLGGMLVIIPRMTRIFQILINWRTAKEPAVVSILTTGSDADRQTEHLSSTRF